MGVLRDEGIRPGKSLNTTALSSGMPIFYPRTICFASLRATRPIRAALSELRTSPQAKQHLAVPSPPGSVENLTGYRSALRSYSLLLPPPEKDSRDCMREPWRTCALVSEQRALLWLQFAYRQRDPGLVYLAADPVFDGVRNDPSFRDLTRRSCVVH